MATAEIRRYWTRVTGLGCAVCRTSQDVTVHHVHGGSCGGLRGMGQKSSDWLVIALCVRHHVGAEGIDSSLGVKSWEDRHGPQLLHLLRTGLALGVDIFDRAGADLSKIFNSSCFAISQRGPASSGWVG